MNNKYVYYTNAIYTNVPKLTDNLLDLCGFLKIETSTKYLLHFGSGTKCIIGILSIIALFQAFPAL